MNKISLTGRLAADSELRFTAGGDAILGFRVADDVGYGEKKTTNWWHCSLFGKRAGGLQQYLAKGQQVAVFGQVVLREWVNKDGVKQLSPDVRVDEVQLMGAKSEPASAPAKPYTKQANPASGSQLGDIQDSDDVPF